MPKQVACLVIGPIPPPLHGFSAVTAAVQRRFEAANVTTFAINTAAVRPGQGVVAALFARLRALARLVQLLIVHRPTTVYVAVSGGHGQAFDIVTAVSARAFRCRLIFHHHSFYYLDRGRPITQALIMAGGSGATHIVLCQHMAGLLQRNYPRAAKILVISNAAFVEPARAPSFDGELQTLQTLGFLSNITIDKGIERFIALVTQIRQRAPQLQAQVAGPLGDSRAGILIERAVTGSVIEYQGPVYGAEKDAFFARIDALVFPSLYANEAEPLVILEALGAGIPVIATARGCIASLVQESNGVLIDAEANDLAPAIERVQRWLDDPMELRAARRAARLKFEDLRRSGEHAMQNLIHGILANHAGGRR